MSKKYKEELNKIVMSDDMKKRILHNVLASETKEEKHMSLENVFSMIKESMQLRRSMPALAGCFAIVACFTLVKNYPGIFKADKVNNAEENYDLIDNSADQNIVENRNDNDKERNGEEDNSVAKNGNAESAYNSESNTSQTVSHSNSRSNNSSDEKVKDAAAEYSSTNKNKSSFEMNNTEGDNKSGSEKAEDGAFKTDAGADIGTPSISHSDTGDSSSHDISLANDYSSINDDENNKETMVQGTFAGEENNDLSNEKRSRESDEAECMGSPVSGYKTVSEAEKQVGFEVNTEKFKDYGLTESGITVIDNTTIQINYTSKYDSICFRAGKDIDNVSGDYNIDSVNKEVNENGTSYTLQGNEENKINLVEWKEDNISYSISSSRGISEEDALKMAEGN